MFQRVFFWFLFFFFDSFQQARRKGARASALRRKYPGQLAEIIVFPWQSCRDRGKRVLHSIENAHNCQNVMTHVKNVQFRRKCFNSFGNDQNHTHTWRTALRGRSHTVVHRIVKPTANDFYFSLATSCRPRGSLTVKKMTPNRQSLLS